MPQDSIKDSEATTITRSQQLAQQYLWHPFSVLSADPSRELVYVRGEGPYLFDEGGNRYLDAFASLWYANVGYGRAEIADVVREQLVTLHAYSSFGVSSTPQAVELAAKLAEIMPAGISRFLFTSGGSESVDTAIKVARRYHALRGEGGRYRIISRYRAYHGTTFGGLSAQGTARNRAGFGPLVPGFTHVATPHPYRCQLCPARDCTLACAEDLEREILFQGPESVAAFIAEPVMGGGIVPPPADYFPKIREICDKYGVLLIADEVVTGFGRTGHMSAMAGLGVRPDILVLAKGITSGYMPLGAAGMSQQIADVFESSGDFFAHGFTFSGHAAACAAALKNIEILEREELGARALTMGRYLHERLVELADRHEIIGEVRGGEVGQLHGLDLVADRATGALHDPSLRIADRVHAAARRRGLIVRPMAGYMIGMSPPLIIGREHCDFIVSVLDEALREVTEGLATA